MSKSASKKKSLNTEAREKKSARKWQAEVADLIQDNEQFEPASEPLNMRKIKIQRISARNDQPEL